ncbi:transaldolase [Glutamicibacter protophormiae]|uniref:Transaldolase n=1 Tax=Glutamicibacter protophormiae TaxID=37930 RepID=A0ABS4XW49_GLUPR|nr:transaldolase [Glutamicibacter protophormiae]MBP2399928.1 transaldolase [Glutamicibacter protophormiae]QRQ77264.1 transaldolase [Glutamicibacter protophormiae]WPR63244.1 transaldolase [Glutamicibacter protophormiae]WPR66740.1 transaldolase [Glutamicibacter protophormiae]GGL76595.1 transaldolase 2 [Glutamicibacter protophormiae]
MSNPNTQALTDAGVSIWLDDLSRERLTSGSLAALIEEKNVVGVTTNPAIFAAALSNAEVYGDAIAAQRHRSVEDAITEITSDDVASACDLFKGIYEASNGFDGRVSIEVDPRLAHETAPTIAQAKALYERVDRENVLIKIPATVEGLEAISETIAEGISVNVTLIFSLERYREVINAYLIGLEKAHAKGLDLSKIHSVASFFVSRVDTEIDKRLDALGTEAAAAVRGQAGVANARLAYQVFEESFTSARYEVLANAGANVQRPLWASTGVKDPAYPSTLYVTELAAPQTVNTMPEKTLDATAAEAQVRGNAIAGNYDAANRVLDKLAALGIDYNEVVDLLEVEGVKKFEDAWNELLQDMSVALKGAK